MNSLRVMQDQLLPQLIVHVLFMRSRLKKFVLCSGNDSIMFKVECITRLICSKNANINLKNRQICI